MLKYKKIYLCFLVEIGFLKLSSPSVLTDVDQFLETIKAVLGSLLERYTSAEISEKLGSSILATIFRQLVTLHILTS